MSQQNINFGTFPGDPSADEIRTAFQKVQDNFNQLFNGQQNTTGVSSITAGPGISVNPTVGNVTVAANIAYLQVNTSTLTLSANPNATRVPVALIQTSSQVLNVNLPGNIATVVNISITGNLTSNVLNANYVSGNGSSLSAITGANVTGNVANATHATTADTAYSVNVANIVGIGNIATLNLTGSSNDVLYGNGVFAPASGSVANSNYASYAGNAFSVSGGNVSGAVAYATTANSVSGSNVSGAVAYATTANSVAGSNVSGAVAYATTANSVAGSNVSGTVANATYATSAGNVASATTAVNVTANAQPNITSVGTLSNLTVSGTSDLGAIGNITITGGSSGYYLQTNGSGVLTWASVPGGTGISNGTSNISVPTANGNVNTSVAGNANILVVTGTGANIAGTLNATGVITGNGSGLTAIVGGNVSGAVAYATTANSVAGSNVSGTVANATYATSAGSATTATSATTAVNVTANSQANITSVGTLTSLGVSGTVTAANITANTGFILSSVATYSAAGSTQGTATALTTMINIVSTVAASTGVVFPTAVTGMRLTVLNTGANPLAVYPATNAIINSQAANASFSLPVGDRLDFIATSTTQWYTLNATYG